MNAPQPPPGPADVLIVGQALTGEALTAEKAEAWGLIWRAVEDDQLKPGPRRLLVEDEALDVRYGALRTIVPETGVLQLPDVVTVPAAMSGNIARIYVRAGARVRRGQALARLIEIGRAPAQQRVDARAAFLKAALDVREDERAYEDDAYLYARRGIARDALMQSHARLQQARVPPTSPPAARPCRRFRWEMS